jgi:hypothetical protein
MLPFFTTRFIDYATWLIHIIHFAREKNVRTLLVIFIQLKNITGKEIIATPKACRQFCYFASLILQVIFSGCGGSMRSLASDDLLEHIGLKLSRITVDSSAIMLTLVLHNGSDSILYVRNRMMPNLHTLEKIEWDAATSDRYEYGGEGKARSRFCNPHIRRCEAFPTGSDGRPLHDFSMLRGHDSLSFEIRINPKDKPGKYARVYFVGHFFASLSDAEDGRSIVKGLGIELH